MKPINYEGVNSIKKLSLPIIFCVILLLVACQADENDLIFVGESENWSAKVIATQMNGEEKYQIQLNYKGHNIQEIENFSYFVETKNNGVINFEVKNASFSQEGIHQKDLLISNSLSSSAEDELVIKVEWSENSESFNLINK